MTHTDTFQTDTFCVCLQWSNKTKNHQGPLNFSKNIVSLVHHSAYCAFVVHIAPSWCTSTPYTVVVVYNVPWVHPHTHTHIHWQIRILYLPRASSCQQKSCPLIKVGSVNQGFCFPGQLVNFLKTAARIRTGNFQNCRVLPKLILKLVLELVVNLWPWMGQKFPIFKTDGSLQNLSMAIPPFWNPHGQSLSNT